MTPATTLIPADLASHPFDGAAIARLAAALGAAAPAGNTIVTPLAQGPVRRAMPLLVIVHPGVLCGTYDSMLRERGGRDARLEIARLAADWRGDVVLVVGEGDGGLDAPATPGQEALAAVVDRVWSEQTTLLAPAFAEDLEHAADWLVAEMKADQRPFIKVTGGWADSGDGCVTILAARLRRHCLAVEVPTFTPALAQPDQPKGSKLRLHPSWAAALEPELAKPYMRELRDFIKGEIAAGRTIHPAPGRFFAALDATPLDCVKAVILGQDPYHGPGQAVGMAFAVPRGVKPPPSLQNIFRELNADLGLPHPGHGCLDGWASQGVLLLNSVLSVESGKAGSHAGRGWEGFTDAVIRAVDERRHGVAFVLWGSHAQKKGAHIDRKKHLVLEAPHPSPLSAHRGFFGSKPFSRINDYLRRHGASEIDWRLD